jgi:hypothetical protein
MAAPIQYGQYRVPEAEECVHFGVGQVCNCIQLRRARHGLYPSPFGIPFRVFRTKTLMYVLGYSFNFAAGPVHASAREVP